MKTKGKSGNMENKARECMITLARFRNDTLGNKYTKLMKHTNDRTGAESRLRRVQVILELLEDCCRIKGFFFFLKCCYGTIIKL